MEMDRRVNQKQEVVGGEARLVLGRREAGGVSCGHSVAWAVC